MGRYRKIETDKSEKTIKRTLFLMGVLILIGITVLVGTSYALFSTTLHGEKKVSIQTGTFQVEMEDGEYIKEESMGTMTDKEGKKTKPYTFTITNASTETIGAYYKLYLTEESGNLNTYYLKYELRGNDGSQKEGRIGTLNSFYINKYLESKESITYELRLWLDEETPDSEQGKNYQSKITVEGNQVEKKYTGVETLLTNFTNEENEEFDTGKADNPVNHKMFVFHHEAGAQQEGWTEGELTDYRFIGADPNNYVTFNGENAGWRIIGIFTVENEKGEKEKRIKLIRKENIGQIAWDTGGVNDWPNASLMKKINPDTGSTVYNWVEESKNMIGDTKWYLGGTANYTTSSNGLARHFYGYERGTETCQTTGKCDTDRPTSWIGKVGLMYPSDYGYATSGGSTTDRKGCLAKEMYNWSGQAVSDCKNNDWLFISSTQWTMSPSSDLSGDAFRVYLVGYVGYKYGVSNSCDVRPVVYLLSDIQYIQGTGSKEDPFIFSK